MGSRRCVRAVRRRRTRCRSFGELGNDERLRRSVGPRRSRRATSISATTGAFAAPSIVALVRLGAPADTRARRSSGSRASRARCASATWRRVVAYEPGGDRRLVSRDGRSTYLLATFQHGPSRATLAANRAAALGDVPDVTLGGGALAVDAGRRPGLGGHRARRADRVPDPVPAVAARLPQRRSRRCCRWPSAASTILLSFLAIRLVNRVNPMSIFALNLINGLGLGLAIDYSLFMVSPLPRGAGAAGATRRRRCAATLRPPGASSPSQRGHRRRRAGGADRLPPALPRTRWASVARSCALIAASSR